jgi:hypothetical protein
MGKNKIAFPEMRQLLALTGDLLDIRPGFGLRMDRLAAGLGEILNAETVTVYRITFSTSGTQPTPLSEFKRAKGGALQRSFLATVRIGNLQLEAMARAERVVTGIGVPAWKTPLSLRSMVRNNHHLYSIQYCDDELAIGLLLERRAGQKTFTSYEKRVLDMMGHSFRIWRTGSSAKESAPRALRVVTG